MVQPVRLIIKSLVSIPQTMNNCIFIVLYFLFYMSPFDCLERLYMCRVAYNYVELYMCSIVYLGTGELYMCNIVYFGSCICGSCIFGELYNFGSCIFGELHIWGDV